MVRILRNVGAGLGIVIALAACESAKPAPPAPAVSPFVTPPAADPNAAPAQPAQPSGVASAPQPPAGDGIAGTVVETMDASSYTYAKVDTAHGPVWVAGPATKLAVGTKLGNMAAQLMTNFRSDTLARTFDQIYFVNAYTITSMPAAAAATPSPADAGAISGTVTETMSSGGYTYALLDHGGTKIWVAGPETKLAVGAKLGAMSGSLMTGFRSTTLSRTFDQIYFISAFAMDGAPASPHGAPAIPEVPVDKIAPAPGGKAIADVFANKAALVGKSVVVRGKVVKVNDGILGRNWLHLRDGSGVAGTNDLLVTSATTAKVGDIVTAKGTVAADKDFGAGYSYALLVEDATLTGP